MKFIAVLKTKFAESEALPYIRKFTNMIPYFEVTNFEYFKRMNFVLDENYFYEFRENSTNNCEKLIKICEEFKGNVVIKGVENIESFIEKVLLFDKNSSKNFGIKIKISNALKFVKSCEKLSFIHLKYLFADCGGSSFKATRFILDKLANIKTNFNIYILSKDRISSNNNEFITSPHSFLDFSYIKNLKNSPLNKFSGYGNYLSMKDELTEPEKEYISPLKNTVAYLLLVNLIRNEVDIFANDETHGKFNLAYNALYNDFNGAYKEKILDILSQYPVSNAYFKSITLQKPYIKRVFALQIIFYAENINKLLSN